MEGTRYVNIRQREACYMLPFVIVIFAVTCKPKQENMEQRLSVRGILQDTAGRPVADAVVMITGGSHEFNDLASVTNENGEFYLSNVVVPGRYTLQIEGRNQSKQKEVNLADSSSIRLTF
jgi:hypothetical protein